MYPETKTLIAVLLTVPIGLLLGEVQVQLWEYYDCRKEKREYHLDYRATISRFRGMAHSVGEMGTFLPRYLIGTIKDRAYRRRYPLTKDPEGYYLEDDAPLKKDSNHTRRRQSGRFVVGGRNETEVIEGLEELVGFSVKKLEQRMYPDIQRSWESDASGYLGSNPDFGGFLKEGEQLLPIMARDNELVLSQGLTHQDLAKPLLHIYNLMNRSGEINLKFIYAGKRYETSGNFWRMGQMSPFSNKLVVPAGDVTIHKVGTDDKFFFSTIHPFLIHGFGFYEGDVPYRIEPQKIIDFWELNKK